MEQVWGPKKSGVIQPPHFPLLFFCFYLCYCLSIFPPVWMGMVSRCIQELLSRMVRILSWMCVYSVGPTRYLVIQTAKLGYLNSRWPWIVALKQWDPIQLIQGINEGQIFSLYQYLGSQLPGIPSFKGAMLVVLCKDLFWVQGLYPRLPVQDFESLIGQFPGKFVNWNRLILHG